MRAAILTREFPPDVYGGAGVHVDFLVRELRRLIDVDVHCMGEPRPGATAHSEHDPRLVEANPALRILGVVITMHDKRTALARDIRLQTAEDRQRGGAIGREDACAAATDSAT